MTGSTELPRILFFNINGSGLGHMSTCLAYANRMRGRAQPVFFSLASAIEMIHDFGFEADYFVSPFWSRATNWAWNRQLAVRLGMMLERVRPEIVVFDGTWPFRGFLDAAAAFGAPRLVWSNLTLYKRGARKVPVSERQFDLVIRLGELGTRYTVEREQMPARTITIPPATLFRDDELLRRDDARDALGLDRDGRYALCSLGPGNLKDVGGIGRGLVQELRQHGLTVVWTKAPISVRDVPLDEDVLTISVYPLARYMKAFDVFVGAAGYNTCCEVIQSRVPSLLVPNTKVIDDQTSRANTVAAHARAVVSPCESAEQRADAVARLLALSGTGVESEEVVAFDLSGAERAADEILALIDTA